MTTEVRTSPKKARKPQRRSLALREAISDVAAEYDRLSVRQLFYQLVSRGVVEKTEHAYKRVCDAAVQMRLDGSLDFRKVTDGHRSRRLVYAHSSLHEALQSAHDLYRRNYWLDQPRHVEVWCEKDALSGVMQPVCDRYGVPYVTRGFPSITLLYDSGAGNGGDRQAGDGLLLRGSRCLRPQHQRWSGTHPAPLRRRCDRPARRPQPRI